VPSDQGMSHRFGGSGGGTAAEAVSAHHDAPLLSITSTAHLNLRGDPR